MTDKQAPRLPKDDSKVIPSFWDQDQIVELFMEEDLREWGSEWPRFEEPMTISDAIEKARAGDPADLIQLAEGMVRKKGRGRPTGVTMSKQRRLTTWPAHRAAGMIPLAEFILKAWYPHQRRTDIRATACAAVAAMWSREARVTQQKLLNYLARSRRHRISRTDGK